MYALHTNSTGWTKSTSYISENYFQRSQGVIFYQFQAVFISSSSQPPPPYFPCARFSNC